ncbi:Uncharacterised protein [Candidatus Gugararchaeum adminiculabundum]|nr:Uncharacterised protein [Candidatus Gugararchaeum adminiculabundum]
MFELLKRKKGQAAMEYLMTYGWAILVIIIILAALLYLGILGPQTIKSCTFSGSEIFCNTAKLTADPTSTTGVKLSLEVQNGAPKTINIVGVACTASATAPTMTGYVVGTAANSKQVPSGQKSSLPGDLSGGAYTLYCTDGSGAAVTLPAGQPYTGKIYLAYCEDGYCTSGAKYHIIVGDVSGKLELG